MLQRSFDALPIDDDVAASYGRPPRSRAFDLLIAATAHANSARLYTRNAADLVGLDDLVEVIAV